MANYPTYNPNNYSEVYDLEKLQLRKYRNPVTDLR
jgi:cell division protein FtsI/penicillin-binding protein 2